MQHNAYDHKSNPVNHAKPRIKIGPANTRTSRGGSRWRGCDMKPLMLAKPAITAPPCGHCVELCKELDLGEIDSLTLHPGGAALDRFFDHVKKCGYKQRDCRRYSSLTLTYVNGSARWHDDPGFGPVVCWLLYTKNPLGMDAQLITRHGPLDMRVGDLCIFDANKPHAWLSNGICVMLMMTVAKLPRSKQMTTPTPEAPEQ